MRRVATILTLAALTLVAGSSGAAAGAASQPISLGVAPSKLQANLIPGQLYKTDLDIYNKGAAAVTLDVYLQDYTISAASAVEFLDPGSRPESAATWAKLSRTRLRMAPHSHQQVRLTVAVPRDAAIGTHTLAVIFRSREITSNGNVKYRPAVASLMAAGVENADGTGLVLKGSAVTRSVDVNWTSLRDVWNASDHVGAAVDWLIHPSVTAHVEIKNDGNTFFNVIKGGAEFTTSLAVGDSGQQVAAPTYTILPGSTRTVAFTWKHAPLFARGDADTRIYYNDSAHLPVVVTPFTIVPWHLIIVVGVLLALFVLRRISRGRGRRRRQVRRLRSPPTLPRRGCRREPGFNTIMHGLLESVPNFSEGRDTAVLDAIRSAMVDAGGRVLDVHSDPDHNRSVFTLVADADSLVDALAAAISVAVARIDLRHHEGAHPRVGAADVAPVVRFDPEDERPERVARALARRVAMLGVPALGYGELGEGRRPAFFRQGGTARLAERMAAGEITPLAGPAELHPSAGAVLIGVRPPLVAFNVDLETADVAVAKAIAAAIRERDGGLPGVQALGLPAHGRAQVSTNLIDVDATPLSQVVSEIERLAVEAGTAARGSELVGLMPARVAAAAAAAGLGLPGMSVDRLLEVATSGEFGET